MANMFALRDSTLNDFLYADIGTEDNGCGLTILSVLARLGKDPWAQAAVWCNTSKDAAVDALTQNIVQMHLRQHSGGSAHSTALRLIGLLPHSPHFPDAPASPSLKAAASVMPGGVLTIVSWALLYLALSVGMSLVQRPHAAAGLTPAPTTALVSKPALSHK